MATFDQQYTKSHTDPERVDFCINVAIGATGAVGTITGTAGFALTRTGVGTYTVTMPKSNMIHMVGSTVDSGAAAVSVSVTALSAANGTATVVTRAPGGAAADVTSGGTLTLMGTIAYKGV